MLIRRFPTKHDRFYKFSQLVALRQGPGGLDDYIMTLLVLQAQIPDMSAFDTLDIYLGGLEPTVRIHLLETQNAGTLERAQEESRNFAKTQGAHDIFDDTMDLTVPTSLARQFPRPPERSHSSSARCSNCGQKCHLRATCVEFPCSPSARPSSLKLGRYARRV